MIEGPPPQRRVRGTSTTPLPDHTPSEALAHWEERKEMEVDDKYEHASDKVEEVFE